MTGVTAQLQHNGQMRKETKLNANFRYNFLGLTFESLITEQLTWYDVQNTHLLNLNKT